MKKVVSIAVAVALASVPAAFAGGKSEGGKAKPIVLKVNTLAAPTETVVAAFNEAAKYINEKSGGRLDVQVFHSGQLGGQATLVQDLQQGQYQIGQSAPANLSSLYPPIGVLNAPYLFKDGDQMLRVLNGDIGKELYKAVEDKTGIKVLSSWYYGRRHLTSNVLGVTPAELSKIKMRIYNAPIAREFAYVLGTNATPIDFNELYLALKTGTVDAQENPLPTIYSRKFYEVQKYLILTGHVIEPFYPIMHKPTWDKLPADLQAIVLEGFAKGGELQKKLVEDGEKNLIGELTKLGMTVVTPPSVAPFQERAQDVFKKYANVWDPALVQKIQAAN